MNNTFGREIIPANDDLRLKALYYYKILDTLPEAYFNNLAHIIAKIFDTPIALISLVDKDRVFFKANEGMGDVKNVDRGESLCSLAILSPEPTIFTDTLEEPCLLANPLVAGEFGLRFYAGAPITTPEGFQIGTVCIVDKEPRNFSQADTELLVKFAAHTMDEIERRYNLQKAN